MQFYAIESRIHRISSRTRKIFDHARDRGFGQRSRRRALGRLASTGRRAAPFEVDKYLDALSN
jgi:hypothetical protein